MFAELIVPHNIAPQRRSPGASLQVLTGGSDTCVTPSQLSQSLDITCLRDRLLSTFTLSDKALLHPRSVWIDRGSTRRAARREDSLCLS